MSEPNEQTSSSVGLPPMPGTAGLKTRQAQSQPGEAKTGKRAPTLLFNMIERIAPFTTDIIFAYKLACRRELVPIIYFVLLWSQDWTKRYKVRRLGFLYQLLCLFVSAARKGYHGQGNYLVCVETNPGPKTGGKGKGKGKEKNDAPKRNVRAERAEKMTDILLDQLEKQATGFVQHPACDNKPVEPTVSLTQTTTIIEDDEPEQPRVKGLKELMEEEELAAYKRTKEKIHQLQFVKLLPKISPIGSAVNPHYVERHVVPNPDEDPFDDDSDPDIVVKRKPETLYRRFGAFAIPLVTFPESSWPLWIPRSARRVDEDNSFARFCNFFGFWNPTEMINSVELIAIPAYRYKTAGERRHRDRDEADRDKTIVVFKFGIRITYAQGLPFVYAGKSASTYESSDIDLFSGLDSWLSKLFPLKTAAEIEEVNPFRMRCVRKGRGWSWRPIHVSLYSLVEFYNSRVILTPSLNRMQSVERIIRTMGEDPLVSAHITARIGHNVNVITDTCSLLVGMVLRDMSTDLSDF